MAESCINSERNQCKAQDAICFTDERIATQRKRYEKPSLVSQLFNTYLITNFKLETQDLQPLSLRQILEPHAKR